MAVAGRETASHYAWSEIASQVLAVYERALHSSAAPKLTGVL
jgi:hypothetical protein